MKIIYDPAFDVRGWFDPTKTIAGWFDDELIDDSGEFPPQFAGLRTYYSAAVKELCLVAEADAPNGMGGVLRIDKNGTTYAVYLVETGDANASNVRIETTAGTKSIRLKT